MSIVVISLRIDVWLVACPNINMWLENRFGKPFANFILRVLYYSTKGGQLMTENAKRAITFTVFAVGIVLGILGWTNVAYLPMTGTIIFLCFLFGSFALRILWGLKRRKGE